MDKLLVLVTALLSLVVGAILYLRFLKCDCKVLNLPLDSKAVDKYSTALIIVTVLTVAKQKLQVRSLEI